MELLFVALPIVWRQWLAEMSSFGRSKNLLLQLVQQLSQGNRLPFPDI